MKPIKVFALGIVALAMALAVSSTGSLRKDLEANKILASMTAPRPVKIDGLKASYGYTFVVSDANRKFPGSSKYDLVMGSADGKHLTMFTLIYNGPNTEPTPSTFGQIIGHLGRHCLGVSEEVLRTVGTDFGAAIQESANLGGKTRSLSKSYGTVVLVGQNIEFGPSHFKFVFYLANTVKPGTTGNKTTCGVKI